MKGAQISKKNFFKDNCTMVILVREGRKKFGYPAKSNYGVIFNAKSMFPCQNSTKIRYKP